MKTSPKSATYTQSTDCGTICPLGALIQKISIIFLAAHTGLLFSSRRSLEIPRKRWRVWNLLKFPDKKLDKTPSKVQNTPVMKPFIPYSLLAAAAACGFAFGQTATTTPVGYITVPIAGNTVANPVGAATYVSATLVEAATYSGKATASPSGGAVITLAAGVPATLDSSYLLEITTGDQEGWWTTVVSSTDTSITVADEFPAALAADVSVTVRKFSTLGSLFGANSPGLKPISNSTEPPFDTVEFLDPVSQTTKVAVYVLAEVGVPADGWYDFVTQDPLGAEVIHPGTAVKVVRHGATPLSLVSTGEVKITKTQVDVFPSFNWLGQSLATGGTLGSMNFYNQIVKFDNGTTANDFLSLLKADQTSDVYVAADPSLGIGNIMANFVDASDATNVAIPEGTGYVFQRADAGVAGTIVIPAQVVND